MSRTKTKQQQNKNMTKQNKAKKHYGRNEWLLCEINALSKPNVHKFQSKCILGQF